MKKSILIMLLLVALSAVVPASAQSDVIFEPAGARFIIGMPFTEHQTKSVGVSLGDGAPIGAIRFEGGSTTQDIGEYYNYTTGLSVNASLDGGGKLTFSGNVPSSIGFGSYPIYVNFYSDMEAEDFIASADFTVEITERYSMYFEDPPSILAGEPLDITLDVTFDDNWTGEEDLTPTLTKLEPDEPDEPYKNLGLTITPDRASSTIRITSDAPVTGAETYSFIAESDRFVVGSGKRVTVEGDREIRVSDHILTFSTPFLLAEATEAVDFYAAFEKKPASVPLSAFSVVMTIEDNAPASEPVSSDTGSLSWNGLTIDLEADKSRLRVHGTAEEELEGELILEGFLLNEDEPRLTSDTLDIDTRQFEEGDLLDIDNATLTGPDGRAVGRMVLNAVNTLTFPLKSGSSPDGNDIPVTVRTPSRVITRLSARDAELTSASVAAITSQAADSEKLVIRYTPSEPGDHIFEVLYAIDGTPYYEDVQIGAGGSSSGGGCTTGASMGAFALLLAALIPLCLRRR